MPSITWSVQLPYQAFATEFLGINLFLDKHGNTISRENLFSGSQDNYAKLETS